MTEEEAKRIIRNDPKGDITARLEALEVAYEILGEDATISEIYKWADKE